MHNDSETVSIPAGSVKLEKQNVSKAWTMRFRSKSGIYIWGRERGGDDHCREQARGPKVKFVVPPGTVTDE